MTRPRVYSFIRYLAAKRTVDDRALNLRIWKRLMSELAFVPPEQPLQVLEVGAGIGTMLERMVEWGLRRDLDYTALDSDSSLLAHAAERLPLWARAQGRRVEKCQGSLVIEASGQRISVEFLGGNIFDIASRENRAWDLVLAHSFLDLVNLESMLAILSPLLRVDGLFYFTLVFDGATIFRPIIDPAFDAIVEASYHKSMDERSASDKPTRHSQTGRMLLEALSVRGVSILDAGSSDWVVFPPYKGDEAYFLHHILHFMEETLGSCRDLDPHRLKRWLEARHRQVEDGRLIYIAHQLDVLGRQWE